MFGGIHFCNNIRMNTFIGKTVERIRLCKENHKIALVSIAEFSGNYSQFSALFTDPLMRNPYCFLRSLKSFNYYCSLRLFVFLKHSAKMRHIFGISKQFV